MTIRRNMLSGGLLGVGSIVINLVSYPFILSYLGAEIFGLWATLSIIVTFVDFGNIGIDRAVIKYTAEAYGKRDLVEIKTLFSTAVVTMLSVGLVLFLIAIVLRTLLINILRIPESYYDLSNSLIPLIVLLSVIVQLDQVVAGTLRGVGRVDLANYLFLVGRALSIVITLLLLAHGYGIWSLFWGRLVFHVLYAIATYCIVSSMLGCSFFSVRLFSGKQLRRLLKFGGLLAASSIVSTLMIPLNKVVLARYVGLTEVAYFEIANSSVLQARSVFLMSSSAIMPAISSISVSARDSNKQIDKIVKKAEAILLCLVVPVFLALYFAAPVILRFWLGDQYVDGIGTAFRIILMGYSLNVVSIPLYFFFMGVGNVIYCFFNHLAQSLLNLILVLILIVTGIFTFLPFVVVYSLSVSLSALLIISLYLRYSSFRAKEVHERN